MSSVMTWVSRYTAPLTARTTPRGISKRPDEPGCRPAVSTWSAIVDDSDTGATSAQRPRQDTGERGNDQTSTTSPGAIPPAGCVTSNRSIDHFLLAERRHDRRRVEVA